MVTTARRQREREGREQAILLAARDLFLHKGISATTMDDVAAACELAKGTLYLYFRSKDEVAFALLLQATEDLLVALRDALEPGLPSVEQLERLAITYYRFFVTQPESFRYMFVVPHESYSGRVRQELLDRWAATGRAALAVVATLVERAGAAGELRVAEPWATAVALWSAVTGVIAIPSQEVRRPFIGDVDVEQLTIDSVRALLRGLRPAESGKA